MSFLFLDWEVVEFYLVDGDFGTGHLFDEVSVSSTVPVQGTRGQAMVFTASSARYKCHHLMG